MNDRVALADRFEADRSRLEAVARRLLGSSVEAEDAVQEAWLRLDRTDVDAVDNLGGWLTTVVSRVCLDRLRARRARREQPVDDEVPTDERPNRGADPEHEVLLADSIGSALLVVLERLSPSERVAFVLHDVFAVPFDDVARVLERSPDATRKLASRARRRVQGGPVDGVDLLRRRQLVEAFLAAARGGDFDALLAVLDPDVVLRPDRAALRMGSLRRMHGATEVAAALGGGARAARLALVDGLPALVWAPGGRTRGVIEVRVDAGRIVALDVIGDPARIEELEIVLL